jgi:hypothetical protein
VFITVIVLLCLLMTVAIQGRMTKNPIHGQPTFRPPRTEQAITSYGLI